MNDNFKPNGLIKFELEGVDPAMVIRWRNTIERLMIEGALNLRNGKVVLHFDNDATLAEIEFDFKKWRRQRSS